LSKVRGRGNSNRKRKGYIQLYGNLSNLQEVPSRGGKTKKIPCSCLFEGNHTIYRKKRGYHGSVRERKRVGTEKRRTGKEKMPRLEREHVSSLSRAAQRNNQNRLLDNGDACNWDGHSGHKFGS